jgi:hypothetical protein
MISPSGWGKTTLLEKVAIHQCSILDSGLV